MPARERRKGSAGESEVRAAFERYGFAATALQRNRGDELDTLVHGYGWQFAVETKRTEVLRLPAWTRQVEAGAPSGYLPLVTYRASREPWRAVMPLEPLLGAIQHYGQALGDALRRQAAADINIAALREQLATYEDSGLRLAPSGGR